MIGGPSLDLKYFKDLVQKRTGLTFDSTRENNLRQKINEMISQRGYRSRALLYAGLLDDDELFLDFVNQLTINETYFFREPQYLKLLTTHLVPLIIAGKKKGEKIKIISAGCSTGEEPYSIAISLMEKFGEDTSRSFAIIGFDINSMALEKAEVGIYGKLSFRGCDDLIRTKYFETGRFGIYQLNTAVRELVQFRRFNLLDNEYPPSLCKADVIFYRNVSIYFDQPTQRKILTGLAANLNEGGYVVFSSSETFSHHDIGALSLIESHGLFYYQKINGAIDQNPQINSLVYSDNNIRHRPPVNIDLARFRKKIVPKVQVTTMGSSSVPMAEKENQAISAGQTIELADPDSLFHEALISFRKKDHARALHLAEILQACDAFRGKAYLLVGCVLMNGEKIREARDLFNKALQIDPLDLEAHMLLGLAAKNCGETDMAITCFNKALYVQNSCWMAYYFLAEIHLSVGKNKKALGYYDTLAKILGNNSTEKLHLIFFPISFQREDLIHLCRKKISYLSEIG